MNIISLQYNVLSNINVNVTFDDLVQKIKHSGNMPELLKTARKTLEKVKNLWKPAAVYQWFEFQQTGTDPIGHIIHNSKHLSFDFGYSIKFLTHATHVLVSVFTAGKAIEHESVRASERGNLLESFLLDLIGLIVLEKAGDRIIQIAQNKAIDLGWGVGPFLSPGSVHGWDIEEQVKLFSLLPLEKIDVKSRNDAVLSPFKSISCLIGLGPGYETCKVGSTCQVCSKAGACQMEQNLNSEK